MAKRLRALNRNEAYKNYHGVTRVRRGTQFERAVDTWNIGDYEMVSIFENPSGNTALGDAFAIDSEADKYQGTVYWTYSNILPSGA